MNENVPKIIDFELEYFFDPPLQGPSHRVPLKRLIRPLGVTSEHSEGASGNDQGKVNDPPTTEESANP